MGAVRMGVRVLLIASMAVAALVTESEQARAQDNRGPVTNLPPVEIDAPRTGAKPGRPSGERRVVRPVQRIPVYPTAPLATTSNDADKVPTSINYVDSNDIKRTGSLNV